MNRAFASAVMCALLTLGAAPGAAAPVAPAKGAPVAAAPKAKLLNIDGLKKAIQKNRGHAVLLHFWATWCHPCLEELPTMNQFARDMKPRGLEVVSISLDSSAAQAQVSQTLQARAPNLAANIYSDDPGRLISVVDPQWQGAIPAVFAYDQKGEMRGRFISGATYRQLEDLVGYMLKPAPVAKKKAGCASGKC